MPRPLAYFLTWTTYGSRLHGDVRGSVDRRHNQIGCPVLPADEARSEFLRGRMKHPEMTLSEACRGAVEHAVRAHAEKRRWRIIALRAQSNHVHVLIDCESSDEQVSREKVMQELKSWATRRLRAEGLIGQKGRIWTDHGSTRWINHEAGLIAAVDYVERLQDYSVRE